MKENLNHQISFRVTDEEYNRLEETARKTNMTVSALARDTITKNGVVYVDRSQEMLPLIVQISDALSNTSSKNSYQMACEGVVQLWRLLNA